MRSTCCPSKSAADDDDAESSSTPEVGTTSSAVIAVDVTGAAFKRQSTHMQTARVMSQLPGNDDDDGNSEDDDSCVQFVSVVFARPPSLRRTCTANTDRAGAMSPRKTAESAGETSRRRARSETREYRRRRPEMTPSSSSTAVHAAGTAASLAGHPQSRGRTTVRQLKRRDNRTTSTLLTTAAGNDSSGLCSWRHSLCAGFKSSKCDVDDMWTESRPTEPTLSRPPSTTSSVSISVMSTTTTTKQSRSQSLPRSFRSSFIAPLRRLLSSRSLGSTSDADTGSVERPSSRRLLRTSSDSDNWRLSSREPPPATTADVEPVAKGKLIRRSRSLERGSNRQTQQRLFSRTASVSSGGGMSSEYRRKASVSSSAGAREVHVDIPDQPWTKPFASVRLRPRRTDDVDGYRSSSGTFLASVLVFFSFCLQYTNPSYSPELSLEKSYEAS